MSEYLNMANCQINEPRETAKMVLENTDAILKETATILELVFSSLNGEQREVALSADNGDKTMMDTLRRQRATAECILEIANKIREVLW